MKALVWSAMVLFVVVAAGCNTVEGVGRDIEAGGKALQDAAD